MSESQRREVNPDCDHAGLHRRTWELELLISGAIVVALFQLPGTIDAVFDGLKDHISHDLFRIVWSVYYPAKLAITPALLVFVVHILLRGFWVGMVGLNAVFPNGIAWDKVNMPPITKSFYRDRTDPREFERKLDRAASLLFAVLFSLLSMTAAMGFWLTAGMVLVVAIASSPWGSNQVLDLWHPVYIGTMLLIAGPGFGALIIDKAAERWPALANRMPGLVSLCRFLLTVGATVMLARMWYPPVITMISNSSKKKPETWRVVVFTVPVTILLVSLVLVTMIGGPLYRSFDSYVFMPPRPQESGLSSRHYESMRNPGQSGDVPVIPSEVVDGPYLRLYLPYDAWRDNDRITELCPDVQPFRKDGDLLAAFFDRATEPEARRAVLGCFSELWEVELNGTPVQLDLVFSDEPRGRGVGVVTYLPIVDLPSGKNSLIVTRNTGDEEEKRRSFNPEKHIFHIPFWR